MKSRVRRVSFQRTINACFAGYVVQAVVNNFVPLLFVMFQDSYQIPLSKITLLITVNFVFQLVIDILSAGFIDKIGYKTSVIIAHFCAAAGLISLTVLPEIFGDPFVGILVSVMIYAVGGGLLEVLLSPIVEACPTANKEKAMSLLHSFYCWGHMGVVLLSTVFFSVFGISNWKVLALIWALIPVINGIVFFTAPIYSLQEEGEKGLSLKELLSKGVFWVMILLMVCSGASEQAVSQWASTFAEQGLGVSKTIGDLAGPMAFAFMMGLSRLFYGKYGDRIDLDKFMSGSTVLCLVSYLCISFAPFPVLSLAGCAVCGFSVGILWPGSFSKAAAAIKGGGTAMFAFLALAGDLGCSSGPTLAGFVSSHMGDNLKAGILAAIIFPVLMLAGIFLSRKMKQ
ncbi:MAG TPA: MFS transporter [Candidatus Blautia excrementigallinarum]|nr:MFS transporter [Candidatus Blautia excrementigallinarum]